MFVCTHRADRLLASVYLADDSGELLVVKVWDGLKVSRWYVREKEREGERREEREGERRREERGERREKERVERREEEREGERREKESGGSEDNHHPTHSSTGTCSRRPCCPWCVGGSEQSLVPGTRIRSPPSVSQCRRKQCVLTASSGAALENCSTGTFEEHACELALHVCKWFSLLLLFSRKFSFNFRIRGRNTYRHLKKE